MTDDAKRLYEMKLFEMFYVECFGMVRRVPGGWVFTEYNIGINQNGASVFVPFDNEFMEIPRDE